MGRGKRVAGGREKGRVWDTIRRAYIVGVS